ncbi:AraC family carnitine catabolism transcriptional activator [Mesorhizobium tianshanense]|uniref:AraC family carnitine catabolism transcriptional activator n=3 Tax=Mesorhizobium tianshanense TaxID=39844 RepID=A0A562P338_9HYPH|nr:AraC family carnitine catabolism transcriptional activator [Mesorhizobium tianshanense]
MDRKRSRLMDFDGQHSVAVLCIEASLHSALLSIEPFRAANRLSKSRLFSIDFVSIDGQPSGTNLDIMIPVNATLDMPRTYDLILLHSSYGILDRGKTALFRWLRRQAAAGAHLCGMDAAPLLLGEAGLLKGYRATSHWSTLASFRELYPDTEVVEQLFVFDRNRSTCAGQLASVDYALFMLDRFCGRALRDIVANDLVYPAIRNEADLQRQIINGHAWHTNPILLRAQKLMQESIEDPLSIQAIADKCGISQRELQHLFGKHLKASPKNYYMTFRLQRAKELLIYSALSIRETGLASGFTSSATYFRAFRARFKTSPMHYRRAFQVNTSTPDGRRLY